MTQLRHLRQQYSEELVIISIHSGKFSSEKSTENIREAVMRHGIDHPVVNDADFEIWQQYAIRAWPTLVLINPQGKIVDTQSGEILAEEYIPRIEALIEEFGDNGLDRIPLEIRLEYVDEPMRPLKYPSKLLLGTGQNLFIADTGHHRILEVKLDGNDRGGEILRVFGNGQPGLKDGSPAEEMFHGPHGMALTGNLLYVADTENHAIRVIDLESGVIETVAGTGEKAHRELALGAPTETPLRSPWALLAVEDVLFIAMAGSHQIWVLMGTQFGPWFGNGREALVDGTTMEASFNQPSDLSLGLGHIFVADSEASAIRVIGLSDPVEVKTLIGEGLFEYGDIDGTGAMVRLQHPTGLTFYDGLIYIADSYNHKIKTLDPTTVEVQTLIGTGQPGHADASFAETELFEPEGIVADEGRLYIADTNNHLIRIADLKGKTVHTLRLRGLERLTSISETENMPEAKHLGPLTVGTGEVEINFDITLPEGYKLNSEAPQLLQLATNSTDAIHTFGATEMPRLMVDVETDTDLCLNLTLYYCEIGDQRLCMVHDTHLLLPLTVTDGGETSVHAMYEISL